MYFTIPQDILGTDDPIVDTDVYLDEGVVIPSTPPGFRHKFGEGYSLTLPTGPRKRNISGSFNARDTDLISLIDRYFTYLEGEPVNGFSYAGSLINMKVIRWQKSDINNEIGSLQAEFEETFR